MKLRPLPGKLYLITEKQRDAFVRWAEESLKPEGLTGLGKLFDDAMRAAQEISEGVDEWPLIGRECSDCYRALEEWTNDGQPPAPPDVGWHCSKCKQSALDYWNKQVTAAITEANVLAQLLGNAWDVILKAEQQLATLEEDEMLRKIAARGEGAARFASRLVRVLTEGDDDGS